MIIKTVNIKNIKKYDDVTYNFTEGIQLILGPNGSGKSTIIESIGWVVFDHLEYKLANWLKWGKDVGFVTVIIYDKENNISYEVFRSTGGEYKITSRGKVLATGVQDVQSYIKKLLNIIDEPAKIFRDIIGVSQEMMASQFSLSASYKKKIFDPILGIEKFSKMWSLLKPVETLLESKMINIEIEKAKIDGWINSANSFKDDYEIKKTELAVIVSDIGTLRSEMNSINEILNTLIEQKNKYDELKRVENEIKIVEGRLGDIKTREDEIVNMKGEMELLKESANKQSSVREKISNMEKVEIELKSVMSEHTRLTKQYEGLRGSIEYVEEQYNTNYEKIARECKDFDKVECDFHKMDEERIRLESEIAEINKQLKMAKEGKCPVTGELCPVNIHSNILTRKEKSEEFIENVFYKNYQQTKQQVAQMKNAKISLDNLIRMKEQSEGDLVRVADIVNLINKIVDDIDRYNNILSNKPSLIKIDRELGNSLVRYNELSVLVRNTVILQKDELVRKLDDLKSKLGVLGGVNFDVNVYDGIKEKHSRTKAIILEKEKYKSEMEIAIKKNKEKVDEIFIKEEELKKLSDNYVILSKKLELVKATREKLRDIPPEIAKNLLIAINNSANRYHNEIVGASTLEIDENYDVLLSDSNGTRGYKNLSGGEKMTASVAIRMAFLNEITNIKFLALDEPTASVDNVRKHLLSDIITKVKGISQLFIITHDDVFIPQSNNIIEVIP